LSSNLTVVIGGGAAGIVAAISKARQGAPVVICEKTSQLGKKILTTGNGRCNLLNDNLNENNYNESARTLVRTVFPRFGKSAIQEFFSGLGLHVYSQDGRFFPVTNQAATVLKVLEMELRRLDVPVRFGFNCNGVSVSGDNVLVSSQSREQIECRQVILTGGGKTYPATGSDGSIYQVAEQIGHRIVIPVPSAVPLVVKDDLCQLLQGQRIQAVVTTMIGGGKTEASGGELLFTRYGLSGTCILDISQSVSVALNREHIKTVRLSIDLIPSLDFGQLLRELENRHDSGMAAEDMLVGILPNKFCLALKGLFTANSLQAAARSLKSYPFVVFATRGWNEAEFTSGGVDVHDIDPYTLESKIKKHVYFAGEVLDVDGRRGGYNLAWAWASGYVAGLTE
jgi:predicted Rossmann fold flavoprotein